MPPHAVRPAAAASAPSPPRHLERRGFCHFPWTGGGAPPERLSWKKNWKISRRSATSARATRRCPAPSCLQRGFDFLRGPAGGIHHSAQKGGLGRETGTGREMRACAQGAARAGGRRGGGGGAVTVRGQCAHAAASPAIWSLLLAPSRVPITVLSSVSKTPTVGAQEGDVGVCFPLLYWRSGPPVRTRPPGARAGRAVRSGTSRRPAPRLRG